MHFQQRMLCSWFCFLVHPAFTFVVWEHIPSSVPWNSFLVLMGQLSTRRINWLFIMQNCVTKILIKYYFRVWDIRFSLLATVFFHAWMRDIWVTAIFGKVCGTYFSQHDEWGFWRQEATASDFSPRKVYEPWHCLSLMGSKFILESFDLI